MKKSRSKSICAGLKVSHAGTVLSCQITTNADQTVMHVWLGNEAKTENPDVVIPVEGKSPVDTFCPSVEGTVILCILKSGEECIYDTRTGKRLSEKELKDRSGEIHFYQ